MTDMQTFIMSSYVVEALQRNTTNNNTFVLSYKHITKDKTPEKLYCKSRIALSELVHERTTCNCKCFCLFFNTFQTNNTEIVTVALYWIKPILRKVSTIFRPVLQNKYKVQFTVEAAALVYKVNMSYNSHVSL